MFKGSYVALVTPFKNGKVDSARLKWLVDFQVEQGTEGLVPCGSTGESATLSRDEHKHVIEVVIKAARGRIPVMAGAGSNSTLEALDLVRHAARVGADSVLQVVPYYNKPTPAGLFEHFKQIAKATKLPIILYNIPGRTGINMPVDTVVRLATACPTIVGIKEASGTMDYTSELLSRLGKDRFIVFSGDDSLTLPLLSLGAKGVISVVANILPGPMAELCSSWENGNSERTLDLHLELYPLMRALFVETNPIPIKAAMAKLGLCRDELRLPLVSMSAEARKKLWVAMDACPLIRKAKS
jgi:4-hydroxy-tetrahydrodipicolinate synthase